MYDRASALELAIAEENGVPVARMVYRPATESVIAGRSALLTAPRAMPAAPREAVICRGGQYDKIRVRGPLGRPVSYDTERYKQRYTVERYFQRAKTWRGLNSRYGKSTESYEAGIYLRGSITWLITLVPAT